MVREHERRGLSGHKKVHIVPVAFEVDRAVLPVKDIGADKVYILTGAQEGEGPKSSTYASKVTAKLENSVKEVVTINYGFYDYEKIFSELVKIGRAEKGNQVFINLSSGGRIVVIAGTLAASMFSWIPYYAEPERYQIDHGKKELSKGVKSVFEIGTYPIEKPKPDLVKCLSLINGIETQKSLMLKLENAGMMSDIKPGESFTKRSYMEFRRRFMEPLLEKEWLVKSGKGKRSRLEITEPGKKIVKIFGV